MRSVYTTEKTDLWGELTHVIAKRSQVHFPGPLDFPLFTGHSSLVSFSKLNSGGPSLICSPLF